MMQDVEILAICKTYTNQTVIGMGALKGAPCTIQGVVDNGDGTQTMTLKWTDTNGDPHTTDVVLPTAIFDITNPTNGQTIRYNSTSGKWENSNVSFSADLGDLDDVVITSAQDGQVLTYDAANNRWINADGSTVADLEDLTDVTITTVQNGQLLSYNSTSQKWVNVTLDIDDLGNVSITSATDGQVLTYDAATSKWINKDVATKLSELEDVQLTSLQNGQGVTYDSTAQKWKNTDLVEDIGDLGDVNISTPTNGQAVIYDGTAGKWQNKDLPTIDAALSTTSENAVQNKVIALKIEQLSASEIGYDGTTSGLTADDVQEAIDELADEKVDKVTGKGLSTNDFTDALKEKLEGIEAEADVNVIEEVQINGTALVPDANKAVNIEMGIDDLTDVDLTGITNGQVLAYDSTNQKMVPADKGGNYTAGDGININAQNVISSDAVIFTGTKAAWDALPLADKKKYTHAAWTDDVEGWAVDNVPTAESNKLVKSGGVYSADANIYAEMTRQGVKNILSQQFDEVMITASLGNKATSANGLTLTYNSDGSIKINGIPTDSTKNVAIRFDWDTNNHPFDISYLAGKKIVASISETEINGIKIIPGYFDASDGAHQYSGADITTKGEYTYPNDAKWARCYMSISGAYSYSDVTVYPMIYIPFEGVTNDYAPYAKTNQQLTQDSVNWEQQNVLGAKNFVHITASSQTIDGITWTVNDDGTVTANGTATALSVLDIETTDTGLPKRDGSYILSDGLASHSADQYSTLTVVDNNDVIHYEYAATKNGDNAEFSIVSANVKKMYLALCIGNGATVSNLVFKPMVRLASIQDDTYIPYSMTNREITPYVQAISNPNLLDNPWFTVNQRGLSTYSNVNYSYTVDRWLGSSGFDLYVDSDGVSVSAANKSIFQRIDSSLYSQLVGRTVTLSVMKANGSIVSATGIVKNTGNSFANESDSDVSLYLTKDSIANFVQIVLKNTTVKVRAVKLELGTVSTLTMDTVPNYQQELAKCQRYYQEFRATNENDWIALGFASTATSFEVVLPLIVPMRVKPTITMTDCNVTNASQQDISLSTINLVQSDANNSKIHLNIAPTANLTNELGSYALKIVANSGKLELSADL